MTWHGHLVFGKFSKGFKGTHRHANCSRNCQSIKRNIIPQIRLSSFRRISPHISSALHINNIPCISVFFFFVSQGAPFIVATFSTYQFRFLLNIWQKNFSSSLFIIIITKLSLLLNLFLNKHWFWKLLLASLYFYIRPIKGYQNMFMKVSEKVCLWKEVPLLYMTKSATSSFKKTYTKNFIHTYIDPWIC